MKFKGAAYANAFWENSGKKPPVPPLPVAAAGGTIAVAALKDGTLVQNNPTPRIMATQTNTGLSVSVLPDSGATLNIASRASRLHWGLFLGVADHRNDLFARRAGAAGV